MNEITWINPLNIYPYLAHWGRSWRDGAPGVGTGNYRRGSTSVSGVKKGNYTVKKINGLTEKEQEKATIKKKREKIKFRTNRLKEENEYLEAKKKNESLKNPKRKSPTELLKEETEYLKAKQENESLKNPKEKVLAPKEYAKAAGNFKGAASSIKSVSSGISSAWESLHQMKYANEDRSKKVKDLSNAELKQVIERIKLDQEYNKLTMPPKSKGYDRTMAALSALESSMNIASTGMSFIAGVQNLKRKYAD